MWSAKPDGRRDVVKIRLRRMGAKKRPFYRIVAADSRNARDGRFIELLGTYDPNTDPPTISVKKDRIEYWLSQGAQPSDTMRGLLKVEGFLGGVTKKKAKEAPEQAEEAVEKAPAKKRTAKAAEAAAPAAEEAKVPEEKPKPKAKPKAEEPAAEADAPAADAEPQPEEPAAAESAEAPVEAEAEPAAEENKAE